MSFLYRLRQAVSRFMFGRYGNDSLNQFLIFIWFLSSVLNLFFRSFIISYLGFVLCFFVLFRMLSRNLLKRQKENAAWCRFAFKVKKSVRLIFVRFRDRKIARFFKCPRCKAPIRMPRRVGKFNVRCSKCGHTFQKEFKK